MVSEHASPLAVLGGVDAGGQNVHVAALACALARRGDEVVVHTRRDDPALPERVPLARGVDRRPRRRRAAAARCPRTSCSPHMPAFADALGDAWRADPPDVVHAHFWMSGHAALLAARESSDAGRADVPRARRRQAPLPGRRRHVPARAARHRARHRPRADEIVATCTDEVFELIRLGATRDAADGRAVRRRPRAVHARGPAGAADSRPRPAGGGRPARAAQGARQRHRGARGAARHGARHRRRPAARRAARRPGGGAAAAHRRGPRRRRPRRAPRTGRAGRPPGAAALGRRRRVRPVVRAVRDRPARGDGVRRARDRVGRGRDDRHGRRRRHRRPHQPAGPRPRRRGRARAARGPARRAAYGRAGVRRARRLYDWDRIAAATSTSTPAARLPPRPGGGHGRARSSATDTGVRHLRSLRDGLGALERRRRPARALGSPARDDAARGRTAAGGRQRRQRGAGPASDGGAGRALSRPSAAPSARCACTPTPRASRRSPTTTASRRPSPARFARTAGPATSSSRCSTSGRSPNVLAAVAAAASSG